MNYFEHHIGDYAEATAHLTFVEDAAYSRLIRKYYAQEKPLPADTKAVQRLVGARSKEEREAVTTVLEEFFVLAADGWHNARCDEEIEHFKAGEPEREAKKANEDNRTKRHREERAQLFQVLTAAGLHAAWNIGIKELRDMVKALPATGAVTKPVTAPVMPVTATQSPIPNHQSPVITTNNDNTVVVGECIPVEPDNPRAAAMPPREDPQQSVDPATVLSVALRKLGVDATFTHPAVQAWSQQNVDMAVLVAAVGLAREQKGPTAKLAPNYLVPIVEKLLNPPTASAQAYGKPAAAPIQVRKPQGMDPKGTDESYEQYDARIRAAEAARRQGPNP
jgi:uncharacterized protein YdaU (DUF1376 family)